MTAAVADTITVSIVGKAGTTKIESTNADTISAVVALALQENGLPTNAVDNMGFVRNGEDANATDKVTAGDQVTAAPPVTNG